jgi:phosphomannomutase
MSATGANQGGNAVTHDAAPLMLSVSGARGIVGKSMTADVARRFAQAFGSTLSDVTRAEGDGAPVVVIGRDGRPSGADFARAACAGLAAAGCRAIDLGIVMTPTVGVMIGVHRAAGGIVITASHNPGEWNGLKCLDRTGAAPAKSEADLIIARFNAGEMTTSPRAGIGGAGGFGVERSGVDASGAAVHVRRVLDALGADRLAAIRAQRFQVTVDSVAGAGGPAAAALLDHLGCDITHLHGEPTGLFPHAPEPVRENLGELIERTLRERAAVGFAQDPDADRLAIVDDRGRYIGEEYTLALCVQRVLERAAGASGSGAGDGEFVLAANMSTSRMIDDIAASFTGRGVRARVVRTAVGEANVVEAMRAAGRAAIVGGEGNGGVIWPAVCWVRDSLSAMALVLELMASREESPLAAIVDSLPRYEMIKRKFDLSAVGGRGAVEAMIERVKREFARERLNDADGVRVDFAEGWVHLRPSNTEPIARLIAEGGTREAAEQLVARVARAAGIE